MADVKTTCKLCPICKHSYNLTESRPKILPCDHTVCKQCIRSLGQEFLCPICKYHIKQTDFVGMTTNFLALELMDKTDVTEASQSNFDSLLSIKSNCELSNDGEVICQNEDLLFSNEEDDSTPTASVDSNEQLCKLEDVKKKLDIIASAKESSCDTKTKLEDSALSLSSVDNVELDLDCKFSNAFDLSANKMSAFESHIELLKSSKEDAVKDIDEEFRNLVQLLLRRKQLLKNLVFTQYEEKLEELEENMEKVTFTTMCLTSLQKHSEMIFSDYNRHEESENENHSQNVGKLHDNIRKIDSEIEDLTEQLEENRHVPNKGFVYQSFGTENVEKGIMTLGRVKMQEAGEKNENSEFEYQ